MLLLIAIAFLAGVVTILSPCILPVLPIVLSGSVGMGKRRPLGIVTGFIFSFTFFTLFLSTLVKLTGISADALRNVSVAVVLAFGLSLLVPSFQVWMEQLFSKLSRFMPRSEGNTGFTGGLLIGLSLGLIWTPCVGPIIASVITLAATSTVNASAVLITVAYSAGTAIPMLAITYGGRTLLQRVPWLLTNSGKIQKAFGILLILTAAAIFFNIDRRFQTYILTTFPQYGSGLTKIEDNSAVKQELDSVKKAAGKQKGMLDGILNTEFPMAPDLIAGGDWFNTKPLTIHGLRGKVVMVDFWTYTCINCIRTLPYVESWYKKYGKEGFIVIGVHTPEFAFEHNSDNVRKAIKDFGITYPVMQDNEYATWNAFSNQYWPAEYLIDKDGRVRHSHFGEGNYDETEQTIQELLSEAGANVKNMPISNPTYQISAQTPESYLGKSRIQNVVSPEDISMGLAKAYTVPATIPPSTFAFGGNWTVGEDFAMPHQNSSLVFHFTARNVYLVMKPHATAPGRVKVVLDGKPVTTGAGSDVKDGIVTVNSDRLYTLLQLPSTGDHTLTLQFLDDTLELFAFTFG